MPPNDQNNPPPNQGDLRTQRRYEESVSNTRNDWGQIEMAAAGTGRQMTVIADESARAAGNTEGLGNHLQKIGQRGSDSFTAFAQTLSSMVPDSLRKNYRQIQQMYGGLGDDIIAPTNDMARGVQDISRNVYNEFLKTSEQYEVHGMGLFTVFEDVNDAMGYFNTLAFDMASGYRMLGSASEETALEMGLFGRALGLTADETSTFIQREISLHGTATGQMLREATVYANKIAAVTGDSAKAIGKNIEAIIANTSDFGNVTVEEAARMSASIRELGLAYEDLSGMVGQFQSFDNAAQSVSALTTVFGVQLDAMELMQLANEDQEGFLRRIRQDFLATGKAVDDLSLAEKRLIQQQLGLTDVESVERLLDPTSAISSFEELTAATAGAGTGTRDAMAEVQDDLQVIDNAAEMTGERIRAHMEEAMREGLTDSAMQAEQQFIRMGGRIVDALVDPTESIDTVTDSVTEFGEAIGNTDAALRLGGFLEALQSDIQKTGEDMGMLIPDGENSYGNQVVASFSGVLGENGPLGQVIATMTGNFEDGWTGAFTNLTADFDQMLENWGTSHEEGPTGAHSMSALGANLYEGFALAFAALGDEWQETFDGLEEITETSLRRMLRDTNSEFSRLAQETGRALANVGSDIFEKSFEDLTAEDERLLAERLNLGKDYHDELEMIWNSGYFAQGREMVQIEERAATFLDAMRARGEEFGDVELDEASQAYGLTRAEVRAYMGQGMEGSLDISDEHRRDILRAGSRRKIYGEQEEEEQAERSESSGESSSRATQRRQEDSRNLQQIAENTGPNSSDPIQIVVQLDTATIVDQIIERPRGTGGRILVNTNAAQ